MITDSAFVAKPGEIVALVGPSGEGKTTMIRLILGLIRPDSGQTFLTASNGQTVEMNVETRHLFAYVPQGNTILSGTIAENMRMVREDATDEEIIEALKISCAWDFVKIFRIRSMQRLENEAEDFPKDRHRGSRLPELFYEMHRSFFWMRQHRHWM